MIFSKQIKPFWHLILLGTVLFISCKTNKTNKHQTNITKPNILIIHIDDLGYHDLSFTGSKIYQTPNVDRLAMESVRFTNAYANYPRCVPSRFAMLTAGYPIKDGDVPDDGFEMTEIPDSQNYVKQIHNTGYQTAYFGKWHLGNDPRDFGFDFSMAAGHAGSPISYIYPFNTPKHKGINKKAPIKDLDTIGKKGDYLTDVLTNQVIKYIKNRDQKKPFMTMLAFYAVHQPLEAKGEDIIPNENEIKAFNFGNQPEYILEGTGRTKMRQDNATYAAMVENMDENVGKLLQTLKDEGIADNTIIIFSSDHGGLSNDGTKQRELATSNHPLRAGKGWLYEGGVKVPLLVKWKNHFQPREENQSIVMLMDIFPTLSDIISGKKLTTDGQSFFSILKNQDHWADRTVFWHSSKARPVNTGDTKSSAIRHGNYKLINWYEEGRTELYNIANDPSETHNLINESPKLTNDLLTKLNNWKAKF
ncbi:sulfatase [Aestuariibaculum suncheonense]|uniref:Sulfatase n=1 Tax=Aestuariibaculum suncheonense TaxID=1028745 RepID=A0A8J6Q9F6_9FLAO|nr:sulfatase [Aestuariibaculum suncheonense]MBD0835645.1 sulfatase [Aestuariibaculum suncheonense]